jgi:hypothetical protein
VAKDYPEIIPFGRSTHIFKNRSDKSLGFDVVLQYIIFT